MTSYLYWKINCFKDDPTLTWESKIDYFIDGIHGEENRVRYIQMNAQFTDEKALEYICRIIDHRNIKIQQHILNLAKMYTDRTDESLKLPTLESNTKPK